MGRLLLVGLVCVLFRLLHHTCGHGQLHLPLILTHIDSFYGGGILYSEATGTNSPLLLLLLLLGIHAEKLTKTWGYGTRRAHNSTANPCDYTLVYPLLLESALLFFDLSDNLAVVIGIIWVWAIQALHSLFIRGSISTIVTSCRDLIHILITIVVLILHHIIMIGTCWITSFHLFHFFLEYASNFSFIFINSIIIITWRCWWNIDSLVRNNNWLLLSWWYTGWLSVVESWSFHDLSDLVLIVGFLAVKHYIGTLPRVLMRSH